MEYHFKRRESIRKGVRRIARGELQSVVDQLLDKGGSNHDEAVHEARKSIKKVRALLRLVQGELGDDYLTESRELREAGRRLSELRDIRAVIDMLDKLKEKYPDKCKGHEFDSIRRGLLANKEHVEGHAKISNVLHAIATSIGEVGKRVKTWPIEADGYPAIEPGLKKTLRRARRGFSLVQNRPRPENYHEWRKRLKDHWYHVRLLGDLQNEGVQGYEKSLKDLEMWLGDDHNLVLLRERLTAASDSYGGENAIQFVLHLIDNYQSELRDNTISLGQRIHQEKPRQFTRRMRQLWNRWKATPKGRTKGL